MKALIFGVSGQDGFFLANLLKNNGIEVIGTSRSQGTYKGDVGDYEFSESLIKTYKPDFIFHLAANSSTRHDTLFENHQTICNGTLNILEAAKLHSPKSKIFLSGSAMQFENQGLPINEQTPFEASSPYSIARIQSVYAGRYYRKTLGLTVYIGYFFNHDSERRTERHVNQKVVSAVKRIANGSSELLELGNIDVKKEFNYAGDIAKAIWTLVNQNSTYEVIIGSGKAYSIRDWTDYCFKTINKNWEDYVTIQQGFTPEYKILVSNPAQLLALGWKPEVDFHQLADIMLNNPD